MFLWVYGKSSPSDLHLFPGDYFETDADVDKKRWANDYINTSLLIRALKTDDDYLYSTDMEFKILPKEAGITF